MREASMKRMRTRGELGQQMGHLAEPVHIVAREVEREEGEARRTDHEAKQREHHRPGYDTGFDARRNQAERDNENGDERKSKMFHSSRPDGERVNPVPCAAR